MLSKILNFFEDNFDDIDINQDAVINLGSDSGEPEVIEIQNIQTSYIPTTFFGNKVFDFKNKIVNPELAKIVNPELAKIVNQMKALSLDQIFYINNLHLTHKREFLQIEFFGKEVLKMYLDVCHQIDVYLKTKNSSLRQRVKDSTLGTHGYDNIFYTLFCISEFTLQEHYYGKASQSTYFSYNLLEEQIDSRVSDYLKHYFNLRLQNLPTIPADLIPKNPSNVQTVGLMYKRLELETNQKKFLEILHLSKNSFLEIDQAFDETARLYLQILNFLRQSEQASKIDFLKNILINEWKAGFNYYQYFEFEQDEKVKFFLESLFRISENKIRQSFGYNRLLDILENQKYISLKCGMVLNENLQEFLKNYQVLVVTKVSLIELNTKNKTRWKSDLKLILENEKNLSILKQKCHDLVEVNAENSNLVQIYFELCKSLAALDKVESLWYYREYYSLSLKSDVEPKSLPASVIKTIFGQDQQKLKKFKLVVENSVDLDPEKIRSEISQIFSIQRKKIKLNKNNINQAQEIHAEMTQTLNQVLGNFEDDQQRFSDKVLPEQVPILNTQSNTNSLQDFFATTSKLDFDDVELELLTLFKQNNYKLQDSQLLDFINHKKLFKSTLLKKLNQKFYQIHEENLIETEEDIYFISSHNQKLL